MKKHIFMAFCIIVFLVSCSKTPQDVKPFLEKEIKNGSILKQFDNHGGFHGDGEKFIELTVEDKEKTLDEIEKLNVFKRLPLTKNLNIFIYGGENKERVPLKDEEGNLLIPEIKNGYYYFWDRHSKSKDPQDDSDLFRTSYNFTIVFYDEDNGKIYYFELDT